MLDLKRRSTAATSSAMAGMLTPPSGSGERPAAAVVGDDRYQVGRRIDLGLPGLGWVAEASDEEDRGPGALLLHPDAALRVSMCMTDEETDAGARYFPSRRSGRTPKSGSR